MSSPVDSTSLLIPSGSSDLCGAILAMIQSISVYRADLDYRVDKTDGDMPGIDFMKDAGRRLPPLYGEATAIDNDYSLVLPVPFASYDEMKGRLVAAMIPSSNTGVSTLKIGKVVGTATTFMEPKSIKIDSTNEVPTSGLGIHKIALMVYDGTQFILLNQNLASSASGSEGIPIPLPTTPGGSYTAASSLPSKPKKVFFKLRCTDASNAHGYAVNDEIEASLVISTNKNQSYPTFHYVASDTDIKVFQLAGHDGWDTAPLACSNIPNKTTQIRTEPFQPAMWTGYIYYSSEI